MCSIYLAKGMSWQEDISMIVIRFNHFPKYTKKMICQQSKVNSNFQTPAGRNH